MPQLHSVVEVLLLSPIRFYLLGVCAQFCEQLLELLILVAVLVTKRLELLCPGDDCTVLDLQLCHRLLGRKLADVKGHQICIFTCNGSAELLGLRILGDILIADGTRRHPQTLIGSLQMGVGRVWLILREGCASSQAVDRTRVRAEERGH
jgi:hypothetical protein